MKLEEDFQKFADLVNLGKLKKGMSRSEAKMLLGEPTDVGGTSRKYRTPCVFKYDSIELHFGPRSSDGLVCIYQEDITNTFSRTICLSLKSTPNGEREFYQD